MHHVCSLFPKRPEESVMSLGAGVTYGCELPCRCWKLNPGLLKEQQVLLTTRLSHSTHALILSYNHTRPINISRIKNATDLTLCVLPMLSRVAW